MLKPITHAIAFVIWNEGRDMVLAVQRPSTDEDVPNVWGLSAGSLRGRETFEACVVRSGREKLGVEVRIGRLIAEGEIERPVCTLHMQEYEIEIRHGAPSVPQPIEGITQYQCWKWAEPAVLTEAAHKGSLCARLFLSSSNVRD
jgi:ADP-ribose pyrophosphatase YjhB (NUDIX family)